MPCAVPTFIRYNGRMVLWVAEIAVIWLALCAFQVPIRRAERPVLRAVVFVLKVLLVPLLALACISLDSGVAYRHPSVLFAAYVALLGDVLASVAEYALRRIRAAGRSARRPACAQKVLAALSFAFSAAVAFYGCANALHANMSVHEWEADGLAREHTFAFIADLHVGSGQSTSALEDLCTQVNGADPEFVILGGDVTDELTTREEMAQAYEILSTIEAPTYFVFGNHDRQPGHELAGGRTYGDEELLAAIEGAGIRVLADEFAPISEDLVLLGREDMSAGDGRTAWAELQNPYAGKRALVVADHQPYDAGQLAQEESALQLSGHTHAGQLWPLQWLYRLLGYPAYGQFEYPGTLLYVSAGAGGWAAPLRTEEHCEWDLIRLRAGTPRPDGTGAQVRGSG